MVKLVAENDPKELSRKERYYDVERALLGLAANLLRVCRGAGRPADIAEQCFYLLRMFEEYRKEVGQYPLPQEIAETLNFRALQNTDDFQGLALTRQRALEHIIAGSLQLVASSYLEQHLQISAGENELEAGVAELNSYHEELKSKRLSEKRGKRSRTEVAAELRKKRRTNKDLDL